MHMMSVCALVCVLLFCSALRFRLTIGQSADVGFSLNGTTYQNNSIVTLEDIGEGDDALLCITDQRNCCRHADSSMGVVFGNWFFPNETRVVSSGNQWDFYRTRGQSVVRLQRRRGGAEGIYRCEIPDNLNITQTIYIGVYNETNAGTPNVTELTFDRESRTLTCTSTGGPATTVTWTKNGAVITPNTTHQQTQTIANTTEGIYENTLTIAQSVTGNDLYSLYGCTVENSRGSSNRTVYFYGDVWFSLKGTTYQNNSIVTLEDIGEGDDSLFCRTDVTDCCQPQPGKALGNWFFPNGTRVVSSGDQWDFHRTRGQSVVRLQRRRGGADGIYRCVIPVPQSDAEDVNQTIFIGVYTASTGAPDVTELTLDRESRTLTCTSTGGPATTVTWTKDGAVITPSTTHQQAQMIANTTEGIYENTLTIAQSVTGDNLYGLYSCTVENFRGSSNRTIHLYEAGEVPPPPPVNETELTPFSAVVRWSPPTDSNGIILHYTVNYAAVSNNSSQEMERRRRQTGGASAECILGRQMNVNRNLTVDGSQTSATLTELTPGTVYKFRVLAATAVGGGPFSTSRNFTTSENVPTEPRGLTVTYLNSTALEVTWEPPLCDYGIRRGYTVTHDLLPAPLDPPGVQGMPGSPLNLTAGDTRLVITDLTPNTNYNITVCAFTSVGCGPLSSRVNQTDEDAPQAVVNLAITSSRNTNNDNTVTVQITWTSPSQRNGSFNYTLVYSADQTPPYPHQRRQSASLGPVMVDGGQQEYVVPSGLPYANCQVTIYAFNIKRGLPGPIKTTTHRSLPIEPSAVTNLMAVATSNQSIRVSWDLPLFPNGPVLHYDLFYRQSDTPQQPPNIISDSSYTERMVTNSTNFEITGLRSYTNYTIHVRATGEGDLLGAIDKEVLQRTNSTTQDIVTATAPTEGPTTANTSLFQLLLAGDFSCVEWVRDRIEEKRNRIIAAVVDKTEQLCRCGFTAGHIDHAVSGFQCSENQHNQVIFRSKLYGTVTTNASTLINHIQQWVSSGISIAVLGLILEVDPTCPVHTLSFSDPECAVTTSPSSPGTDMLPIIAGVVAGVVIVIAITLVVIAVVIKRRRKSSHGLRNLNIGGDSLSFTATNEYAIKTMNCPAYEDWNQPTSEDHTYECILFHPEDNPQQDSNGLYD